MTTQRDYLVSKGLAKPGRGRFSGEAKAAIAAAIAEGMVFSDAKPAPAKPKATKPKVDSPKDTPETVSGDGTFFESDYPHYGKRWYTEVKNKRVEVSNRAACANCRYSLIAHICNTPEVIYGSQLVSVVSK